MLGARIRGRRTALGISQDALAARINRVSGRATVTRSEVSRWESGRRRPTWYTLGHLVTALETTAEALIGAEGVAGVLCVPPYTDDAVTEAVYAWQTTEAPQIRERHAGAHVGARLVSTIEARTHDLRLLDDYVAGRDLEPLASRELRITLELIKDARYTERTGRRLLAAASDLAQVAGWVASDAGRRQLATRYYLTGVRTGHAAGRDDLAASSLSSLAYQQSTADDPVSGVLLARTAECAEVVDPIGRALLSERVAWASARVGDRDGALRALDTVDDTYADTPAPAWAYWLDRGEIAVMRGRVLVELGHGAEAADVLAKAIAAYPADRSRELALYRTYLAEALTIAGERDEAQRIVAALPTVASDRVAVRVADMQSAG